MSRAYFIHQHAGYVSKVTSMSVKWRVSCLLCGVAARLPTWQAAWCQMSSFVFTSVSHLCLNAWICLIHFCQLERMVSSSCHFIYSHVLPSRSGWSTLTTRVLTVCLTPCRLCRPHLCSYFPGLPVWKLCPSRFILSLMWMFIIRVYC